MPRKHRRGREGAAPKSDAGCSIRRGCPCIGAESEFFFFFLRFAPTRLDSHRIGFDSRRTGLIRSESSRIGHIGAYRPTIETGRKWLKQTQISLESSRKSLNSHLRDIVMCFLPFSFFVL